MYTFEQFQSQWINLKMILFNNNDETIRESLPFDPSVWNKKIFYREPSLVGTIFSLWEFWIFLWSTIFTHLKCRNDFHLISSVCGWVYASKDVKFVSEMDVFEINRQDSNGKSYNVLLVKYGTVTHDVAAFMQKDVSRITST